MNYLSYIFPEIIYFFELESCAKWERFYFIKTWKNEISSLKEKDS